MADRDAKLDPVYMKETPRVARHVERIFAWIELVLGLVSLQLPVRINHERGNLSASICDPFHAEDRGHCICSRPL